MTISPDAPPLECSDLAEAVAGLRGRGLRLSSSRRLVLEALFAADGPVSAEHVARLLNLDLATVYRNLETFERHGLVRHVHLGHGPGLYALLVHGAREYLFCERCGAVHAVQPEELDPIRRQVRRQFGYEAHFAHFAIVGTCPTCSALRPRKALARHQPNGGRAAMDDQHEHQHDHPHTHEHEHDDGTVHEHAHVEHEHEHVEHEHEHSHGDQVHSHAHVHEQGLEDRHEHGH